MTAGLTTSVAQFRVLPARRGGWRVESLVGTQAECATPGDAEAAAHRLVQQAGGGEVLVYDAYLRLRAVKRLAATSPHKST